MRRLFSSLLLIRSTGDILLTLIKNSLSATCTCCCGKTESVVKAGIGAEMAHVDNNIVVKLSAHILFFILTFLIGRNLGSDYLSLPQLHVFVQYGYAIKRLPERIQVAFFD